MPIKTSSTEGGGGGVGSAELQLPFGRRPELTFCPVRGENFSFSSASTSQTRPRRKISSSRVVKKKKTFGGDSQDSETESHPNVNVGEFERDWAFFPTTRVKKNKQEMSSEYDGGAAVVLDVEGFLSGETIKICKHFLSPAEELKNRLTKARKKNKQETNNHRFDKLREMKSVSFLLLLLFFPPS